MAVWGGQVQTVPNPLSLLPNELSRVNSDAVYKDSLGYHPDLPERSIAYELAFY